MGVCGLSQCVSMSLFLGPSPDPAHQAGPARAMQPNLGGSAIDAACLTRRDKGPAGAPGPELLRQNRPGCSFGANQA